MRYLSPAVPQGGTKEGTKEGRKEGWMDGWSLPAILIRFLQVQIFNIGCPREMKVLISEIEFVLSSQGLTQNEDSSNLPEQDEDWGIKIRPFQSNDILLPHYSTFLKIYGEKADLMKGYFD